MANLSYQTKLLLVENYYITILFFKFSIILYDFEKTKL